jgi:parallel beta-helix repeat protein
VGGGGISLLGGPAAQILNNVIENNVLTSADGGGVSMFGAGSRTISGNIIRQNTVSGLSPCAEGGGIWLVNQSDALIVNNVISGNSAGCGGGIYGSVPSGNRGPYVSTRWLATRLRDRLSLRLASVASPVHQQYCGFLRRLTALYCDGT